jgi:hypothetical protein
MDATSAVVAPAGRHRVRLSVPAASLATAKSLTVIVICYSFGRELSNVGKLGG